MALGNSPCLTPRSRRADDLIERELGCSHWPGLIGRKRVFISNALELPSFTSPPVFSLAKHHNNTSLMGKSRLESLADDVLVRLLCGVNHQDLNHVVCVSKTIRCGLSPIWKERTFVMLAHPLPPGEPGVCQLKARNLQILVWLCLLIWQKLSPCFDSNHSRPPEVVTVYK